MLRKNSTLFCSHHFAGFSSPMSPRSCLISEPSHKNMNNSNNQSRQQPNVRNPPVKRAKQREPLMIPCHWDMRKQDLWSSRISYERRLRPWRPSVLTSIQVTLQQNVQHPLNISQVSKSMWVKSSEHRYSMNAREINDNTAAQNVALPYQK